ncbi:hypothetical protein SODALDRAFT_327629 [Sodiomyces alkalinus F11]|uniref:Uncharacterized protein n=1 Tax=Sodiomyces alkalinus (strain CBS 110278 / VKM F-3762 / F11) TaxID=1314773 RepID=A0A3N2Q9U5_SODAK|nr:hypothetical protein SODALDRAFT_327629 [Sodiomyces alkalinus F11]ROT43428.1 hypothetical protein SODALDRAFT_327629 [Sodiomyces alkalinus F11]
MREQHTSIRRTLRICSSRRFRFLFACVTVFSLFSLLFSRLNTVTGQRTLSRYANRIPSVPKIRVPTSDSILNDFRQPVNPLPREKNDIFDDRSGSEKLLSVPFSSALALALDEYRSILPPLEDRAPIYCYHDPAAAEDRTTADAESDLLLTWRRAWWAHGFRPIILGPADALNNPLYGELQRLDLEPAVKTEITRWLAWETAGGGLLSFYTVLPMGPEEDPELIFLRRGIYPKLIRWQGLDDGLLAGSQLDVLAAIKHVLASSEPKQVKGFLAAAPTERFQVDDMPKPIVYYDASLIKTKYGKVNEALNDSRARGLKSLNLLINSHLHAAWQNHFSDGIAVMKPLPEHSTHMISDARQLAVSLSQCSPSPMVNSCPPNNDQCNPCVSSRPMHISTPGRYQNISTLYTIGTVPHPYTTALLRELRKEVDIPWIRWNSPRDPWLRAATMGLLGATVSSAIRVVRFKEMVASQYGTAHSLWLTAEKLIEEDKLKDYLDWHFGFAIPYDQDRGYSDPGPGRRPKPEHDPVDGPVANEADLALEPFLLQRARELHVTHNDVDGEEGGDRHQAVAVRAAIEAWNLGDTEAWKFATAFLAQRIVERLEWEKDESG